MPDSNTSRERLKRGRSRLLPFRLPEKVQVQAVPAAARAHVGGLRASRRFYECSQSVRDLERVGGGGNRSFGFSVPSAGAVVSERVTFATSPEGPKAKGLARCKCLVQNGAHEIAASDGQPLKELLAWSDSLAGKSLVGNFKVLEN